MTTTESPPVPPTTRRWRPRPNPVLRRELVERWRGRRAFLVMTLYLGVLTAMMLLLLWAASTWVAQQGRFNAVDPGPTLGRFLLENVFALVLLLVLFVGPGYAAAQISQERERRTLGLLQITLVSPWRIVTGKLGAASAWLLLLVALAAPMAAAAFFLGGVTVGDLFRGVAYLAVITVSVAAIGIGISSVVRRTVAAVVLTYAMVLLLIGGTVFGTGIEMAFARGPADRPVSILANPFLGLADAVRASGDGVQLPSMLTPFVYGLPARNRGEAFASGQGAGFRAPVDPAAPQGQLLEERFEERFDRPVFDVAQDRSPVWLGLMALYAAMGLLSLLVASRRVRPGQEPRARPPRRPRGGGDREVVAPGAPPPAPPPVAPPPIPHAPPPPPEQP